MSDKTSSGHEECRDVGGCGPDCPWCAYPAMTVAELIEALSKLPPDAGLCTGPPTGYSKGAP